MNFLELAQATRRSVGMQGSGPSSITGASAIELEIIDAVRDAWTDIQNFRQEWMWMRNEGSFSTVVDQNSYTLAQVFGPSYRFKNWIKNTLYALINGQWTPLIYINYEDFIAREQNSTLTGPPSTFTIVPWNDTLMFNTPDAIYTIKFNYYKSPQVLTNATDIPECPTYYHTAIQYHAVEKFSNSIVIPEKQSEAAQSYAVIMGQMMRDQLQKKKVRLHGIA